MSLFLRVANTMIKNFGKLSTNQRKFLVKSKGKLTKAQIQVIRNIHNNKKQMVALKRRVSGSIDPDIAESASQRLSELQLSLRKQAKKAS